MSDQSDPIPAEDRPHRVSALTGLDPDAETQGIDPANRAQGAGRFDDDEHAARVAESDAATEAQAAAARGTEAPATYQASQVEGRNAADVVAFLRGATGDADREARAAVVRQVEEAREGGPRQTVLDELER